MLRLVHQDSGDAFAVHHSARIGRVAGNDIVLAVSHISSRHAEISVHDGSYHFRDLGSTNGSLILRDGRRLLLGPRGVPQVELRDGDLLVLGDIDDPVRLRVQLLGSDAIGIPENTIVARRTPRQTAEISRQLTFDRQAIEALFGLVNAINSTSVERREAILEHVAQATAAAMPHAVDALVALRERNGFVVRAATYRNGRTRPEPDQKICAEVAQRGEALLFGGPNADVPARTLANQGIGSGIAAPLWRADSVVGVLQVNCAAQRTDLGEHHLDVAVVLAHHAAVALERSDLIARLRDAEARLRDENALLRKQAQPEVEIVAESSAMRDVLRELRQAAASDVTVLLQGETGTGKEMAARYLHRHSLRSDRLMVPVNCGALSETLLDSELFGHRKGAFTGATTDRKGVFEVADGGTVFLDEVGEMPAQVQVRLLRVLDGSKIKRVGEAVERAVNVRIVAATNRDLTQMVDEGRFRRDLFYRLRVFPVRLPPLRQRVEDIEPLCHALATRHAQRMGKRLGPIEPSLVEALQRYAFPGNVRELVNELERAAVRVDEGQPLGAELLSEEVRHATPPPPIGFPTTPAGTTLREQLDRYERQIILACLARHQGRKAPAASELGLTRQGLAKKMARLRIE